MFANVCTWRSILFLLFAMCFVVGCFGTDVTGRPGISCINVIGPGVASLHFNSSNCTDMFRVPANTPLLVNGYFGSFQSFGQFEIIAVQTVSGDTGATQGSILTSPCVTEPVGIFQFETLVSYTAIFAPGTHTITAAMGACPGQILYDNATSSADIIAVSVTPTPSPTPSRKFVISLGNDGAGHPLAHTFDQTMTTIIPTPFIVKLGEQFPLEIAPLQDDGTPGLPLLVTESITDVITANGALNGSTSIPGDAPVLFDGKVLLHFAPLDPNTQTIVQTNTHHDFFPIHSGQAKLHLTFTFNGQTQTFIFPVSVTNCAVNGDCTPQLGTKSNQFDNLLMFFADRDGIPPQLLKAQIDQESQFNPLAFRYEPLSYDWKIYHSQNVPTELQPWLLAEGNDTCTAEAAPAGANITGNGSPDVVRRSIYGVFTRGGVPMCRVTPKNMPNPPTGRRLGPGDNLISMENILFANDQGTEGTRSSWSVFNAKSFNDFVSDFQPGNPPFTGQTVIASSYGLHQLMYGTAVNDGYQKDGVGLPPNQLFVPFVSLDLGSRHLGKLSLNKTVETSFRIGQIDWQDETDLMFNFGPAVKLFNSGPHLLSSSIRGQCGSGMYTPSKKTAVFDYPCLVLVKRKQYAPMPLVVPAGGN